MRDSRVWKPLKKSGGKAVRIGLNAHKANLEKCRTARVYPDGKRRISMHCDIEFYGDSYRPAYTTPKGLPYIQNGICSNPHIFSEGANRALPQYPRPATVSDDEFRGIVFDTVKKETKSYIE